MLVGVAWLLPDRPTTTSQTLITSKTPCDLRFIPSSWPSSQALHHHQPSVLASHDDPLHQHLIHRRAMISSVIQKLVLLTVPFAYIGISLYTNGVVGLQSSYAPPTVQRPHGLIFSGDEVAIGVEVEAETSLLTESETDERILASSSILGFYNESSGQLANWMANVPDNISLVTMNIPGTHDSATWNYTEETQESLTNITGQLPPAIAFQCQNRSLFQMLGDGIRFFDFRVGFLPGSEQLGFFHAQALLSYQATLPDVLLGFYRWLDDHPTETVLISIKVDNATFADPSSDKQPSSPKLQGIIQELLTGPLGSRYWLQKNGTLGSLGEARGKLIFVQRIEWDSPLLGIALPPSQFNDNDPSFSLVYNERTGGTAYIEDFYNIIPKPSSFTSKVDQKLKAILSNLKNAAGLDHADQLYISFASGGALRNNPPITPQMLAVGRNGTAGVNTNLAKYINHHQGERFGVVLLDWYESTPDLVESIIQRSY